MKHALVVRFYAGDVFRFQFQIRDSDRRGCQDYQNGIEFGNARMSAVVVVGSVRVNLNGTMRSECGRLLETNSHSNFQTDLKKISLEEKKTSWSVC